MVPQRRYKMLLKWPRLFTITILSQYPWKVLKTLILPVKFISSISLLLSKYECRGVERDSVTIIQETDNQDVLTKQLTDLASCLCLLNSVYVCVYLGMLSSTVAHPYRKTMTPTREAGISIWVYRPNQAKYRPIFSPKYFLNDTKNMQIISIRQTKLPCEYEDIGIWSVLICSGVKLQSKMKRGFRPAFKQSASNSLCYDSALMGACCLRYWWDNEIIQ